jgi:flagellar biogenesis protein FliO
MPVASILATVLFCGGLIAVAVVLGRYRDRLQRRFNTGHGITIRAFANLGDGARLCLVEVAGATILCGLGRGGVLSMERLDGKTATGTLAPAPVLPAKEPFVLPARADATQADGPATGWSGA